MVARQTAKTYTTAFKRLATAITDPYAITADMLSTRIATTSALHDLRNRLSDPVYEVGKRAFFTIRAIKSVALDIAIHGRGDHSFEQKPVWRRVYGLGISAEVKLTSNGPSLLIYRLLTATNTPGQLKP